MNKKESGYNPEQTLANFVIKISGNDNKVTTLFSALTHKGKKGIEADLINELGLKESADKLIENGLAFNADGKIFLNLDGIAGFSHEQ